VQDERRRCDAPACDPRHPKFAAHSVLPGREHGGPGTLPLRQPEPEATPCLHTSQLWLRAKRPSAADVSRTIDLVLRNAKGLSRIRAEHYLRENQRPPGRAFSQRNRDLAL